MSAADALLGTCQDALHAVHDQLVDSAAEHLSAPAEVSLYYRERDELVVCNFNARSQIWKQTLGVSELILANLTDHVLAVKTLLDSGYPLYAHGSLARVAFEAGLRLRYLLDHRVDLETRLLRGAATLLHSAREDVRAVSEMLPSVRALPKGKRYLERKLEEFQRLLAEAGMNESKKEISWPAGRTVQLGLNITDQAREVGGFPGFYRLSSGMTHSGPWMLDDLPVAEHGMKGRVADPISVGGMVDATIGVCIRATEVHARYYGRDFVTDNNQAKRHRKAVVEAMARVTADMRQN